MMVQPITDHVERGLSRLIDQYRDKPRIRGLIESWLEEVQELSDQVWATLLNRLIDHAQGVHLQTIGDIVGQPYRGEEQERYRTVVRARIAVNLSSGRVNDLIRVAKLALDGARFSLAELFPATVLIDAADPIEFGDVAFQLLNEARAGGVALTLHYFEGHNGDEAFTWADGDEFEDDAARGFSGDNPDIGPGGLWIGDYVST